MLKVMILQPTTAFDCHHFAALSAVLNARPYHAGACSDVMMYLTHISLTFYLWDMGKDETSRSATSHLGLFCLLRDVSSKN